MITGVAATGMVTHAASSAAGGLASKMILNYFTGINPTYNKESRRRMRYIQQKYAYAYGSGVHGEDACSIIQQIDPGNRLLMDLEGRKPANPFPDERSFEDSLQLNFHPVSGHQGRFVASHAMSCLGVIIDYQNKRRKRPWVPGVISPGRPNDYINLFLEESKTWLKTQLTLDSIHAEELEKRDAFYTKLKNDNYYWCFPSESESSSIHKVITFVHEKVKNALEVVSREEKNKSLQSLFKELNDHTTNSFEFGKTFLAYLLYPDKNAGTNITANMKMDGKTVETGKLHRILEQSTEVVFKSYVNDMNDSINNQKSPEVKALEDRRAQSSVLSQEQIANLQRNDQYHYAIRVEEYEESITSLKGVAYLIEISDPKGHKWIVRKHFSDCESLHAILLSNVEEEDLESFLFPTKISKMFPKREDYLQVCKQLTSYYQSVFDSLSHFNKTIIDAISAFIDVKYMIIPQNRSAKRAEDMPNLFLKMKREFAEQLVLKKPITNGGGGSSSAQDDSKGGEEGDAPPKSMSKSMVAFKKTWGIEWVSKIFEAYSHLQRMATILSWTLEINHFFVSMFGNTLAFSKLPLRDILSTQKDIMNNFLVIANDIYKYACKLNSDQQYKWHKNLQMTENELLRLRFHIEKAIGIINVIESDHLDYEAQMRRLRDVNARFQPLMNRIDGNLLGIQSELGLPPSTLALPPGNAHLRIPGQGGSESGGGNGGGYLAIEDNNSSNEKSRDIPYSSSKYLTNEPNSKTSSMDKYESVIMSSNPTNTNNAAPGKRSKDANNELESMPTSERVEELPASSSSSSSSSSRDANRRVPLSPSQVALSQEQNNGADASPSHPIPEGKTVSGEDGNASQVCTIS